MRYPTTTFERIIKNNKSEIINYLLSHIDGSRLSATKDDKIELDCPYCMDNKHKRYKMMINMDWSAKVKCYRCGKSISIFTLAKKLNFYDNFIAFLQTLTSYNILDLKNIIKTNDIIKNVDEINPDNVSLQNFIKEHGLLNISKLKLAYKYALSRVYNNKEEVEKYFADEKYIYIPITFEGKVVSFIGRSYIPDVYGRRFKTLTVVPGAQVIGFFDDALDCYGNNCIYITEGYFDAYAINYSMCNYVAISSMGKGKRDCVVQALATYFPASTKIYLALDSVEKDKEIYYSNIDFGKKLITSFESVYVINLPDSDPADILAKNGSLYLKKCLEDNTIPFLKYSLKYRR